MSDPTPYSDAVESLLVPRRWMELGPGKHNDAVEAQLEALSDVLLFGGSPVVDHQMAAVCRAGLWLYHDFLDRSHEISQEIDTPTGSYWHAIMHRREGDFSNSKYWFHRVGRHEIFPALAEAATPLLSVSGEWDPFRFVDLCQRTGSKRSNDEAVCRQVQQCEWDLLFEYCYRRTLVTG